SPPRTLAAYCHPHHPSLHSFPTRRSSDLLIAQANSHPDPATLRSLAKHPYWIALGHYEKPLIGGWRSYVDDPGFFLSERGEHSPLAELEEIGRASCRESG